MGAVIRPALGRPTDDDHAWHKHVRENFTSAPQRIECATAPPVASCGYVSRFIHGGTLCSMSHCGGCSFNGGAA